VRSITNLAFFSRLGGTWASPTSPGNDPAMARVASFR
jgi:hypothetical protein